VGRGTVSGDGVTDRRVRPVSGRGTERGAARGRADACGPAREGTEVGRLDE
jgi:hypothetical protein